MIWCINFTHWPNTTTFPSRKFLTFLLLSLQNSYLCFCSNTYGRFAATTYGSCDTVCPGDGLGRCGGSNAAAVYDTAWVQLPCVESKPLFTLTNYDCHCENDNECRVLSKLNVVFIFTDGICQKGFAFTFAKKTCVNRPLCYFCNRRDCKSEVFHAC